MAEKRWSPYVHVTWIRGLIAGDQHCAWSSWFKSHFQYIKRVGPDGDANRLAQWKAEHAQMVQERAEAWRAGGWTVTVEDQNKFTVKGQSATVGGVADIVAIREDEIRVEDCKTGKRRDSDYFQVVLYVLLLPLVDERFTQGERVSGIVSYKDGTQREVLADDAARARPVVFGWIMATGSDVEPSRVPSAHECRYCDVAECPDRIEAAPEGGRTGAF